jgi:hypothetical protein
MVIEVGDVYTIPYYGDYAVIGVITNVDKTNKVVQYAISDRLYHYFYGEVVVQAFISCGSWRKAR